MCSVSSMSELTYVKDRCILILWLDLISPLLWILEIWYFRGKESDSIFLCRLTFSLLIELFRRLLWQIPSPLAFRAACIVLQLVTLFGFLSSGHSWITNLLLLEELRSLENLQVCYCQRLLLILGSLFQGQNVFFFTMVTMVFSPPQHLRPRHLWFPQAWC